MGRSVAGRIAAKKAVQVRKPHRAGVSKAEIARQLNIGRTFVRPILADLQLEEIPGKRPSHAKAEGGGTR